MVGGVAWLTHFLTQPPSNVFYCSGCIAENHISQSSSELDLQMSFGIYQSDAFM